VGTDLVNPAALRDGNLDKITQTAAEFARAVLSARKAKSA
jgi:hypothetical protein